QREPEDGAGVTPVEILERGMVAACRALDQLAVTRHPANRTERDRDCIRHNNLYVGAMPPDLSSRPPSTTTVVPVTKPAPARYATASATPSGEPTRPSSVSAARRGSCSGSTATGPGATPHTRTSGANARASTRVSIACAA